MSQREDEGAAANSLQSLLTQAELLSNAGDGTAIWNICEEILEIDPDCGRAYLLRADSGVGPQENVLDTERFYRRRLSDYDRAIRSFTAAIVASPSDAASYRMRATARLQRARTNWWQLYLDTVGAGGPAVQRSSVQHYALALEDVAKWLDLSRRDAGALLFRAQIYAELDEVDLALADIQSAIDLQDLASMGSAYNSRAELRLRQGALDAALSDCDLAIEQGCVDGHRIRGDTLLQRGEPAVAYREYRRFVDQLTMQGDPKGWLRLWQSIPNAVDKLIEGGDLTLALKCVREYLSGLEDEELAGSYALISRLGELLRRDVAARGSAARSAPTVRVLKDLFERRVGTLPVDLEWELGNIPRVYGSGVKQVELSVAELLVDVVPRVGLRAIANVCLRSGGRELPTERDYRRALAALTEVVRLDDGNPHDHEDMGRCLLQLDEPGGADREYTEAIQLWGGDLVAVARCYHARAAARSKLGDVESAIDDLNRAIGLAPSDDLVTEILVLECLQERAAIHDRRGDWAAARASYEECFKLRPDSWVAGDIARCCSELGDSILAVDWYSRAIELAHDDPEARARYLVDRAEVLAPADPARAKQDLSEAISLTSDPYWASRWGQRRDSLESYSDNTDSEELG